MKSNLMHEVILALIPYTKQNIELSLRPAKFIRELGRTGQKSEDSYRAAFYRAKRAGYFKRMGEKVVLTDSGWDYVNPAKVTKMLGGVQFMVIFDIPERLKVQRNLFRYKLKEMSFCQVQKSVWTSEYNYHANLKRIVKEMKLANYVILFECVQKK